SPHSGGSLSMRPAATPHTILRSMLCHPRRIRAVHNQPGSSRTAPVHRQNTRRTGIIVTGFQDLCFESVADAGRIDWAVTYMWVAIWAAKKDQARRTEEVVRASFDAVTAGGCACPVYFILRGYVSRERGARGG